MLAELLELSRQHRVVVISGENGSGKSTLLDRLENHLFQNKIRFGVLSQHSEFAEHLSVEQLSRLIGERANNDHEQIDLSELLGRSYALCSSGEKAKIRLSLALGFDFVILDEPLAHLDEAAKLLVSGIVEHSSARFVIANHDPDYFRFGAQLRLSARF